MTDEFVTVARSGHAEMRVLASRFLADAIRADTRQEVDAFLQAVRKRLHDATHHCFAYRLGPDGQESRASDGGEPGGTAGKPILSAIDREGLTNVLVVVTRYFGGTKLGTGGLVRAYGEGAILALREAGRKTQQITALLSISVEHPRVSQVMHTVSRCGAMVRATRYDDVVHFQLEIRRSRVESLREQLIQATSGGVRFEDQGF
jgi:uncharacterized YigZ family protein